MKNKQPAEPGTPERLTRRQLKSSLDPRKAARVLHLHYVTGSEPGILRKRKGKTFQYTWQGKPLKNAEDLERIRSLVIPPAWENVWIAKEPNAHLQVTGTDVRGRKQYRYHPDWTGLRAQTKFYRMHEFGLALPAIRKRIQKDLSKKGLPREKVLAAVLSIMEHTSIRIGNACYEQLYGSFGLSTMKDKHVHFSPGSVRFTFVGKKGVRQDINLHDRKLARIVRDCREIPGAELFQYRDSEGKFHCIDSGQVNQYIHDTAGTDFTSKDFRTWNGSVLFLQAYKELLSSDPEAVKFRKSIPPLLDTVAKHLGNTRSVCKKHYVYPLLLQMAEDFQLYKHCKFRGTPVAGLSEDECMLLKLAA